MELQLRRMLAKVTVMDSEALLMSSVRIVDMAPGEKDDDCFSSCVLLTLLSVLPSSLLSDVVVVAYKKSSSHSRFWRHSPVQIFEGGILYLDANLCCGCDCDTSYKLPTDSD